MLYLSPLLVLLVTYSYCMEMHETVERMVMVRTTGSDLQPAATGFIYKKENDGEEKVVKLGESEVMEQLSKMYEQPKAFAAPIPVAAGPFYAKENYELNAPSNKDERVIPVKENVNEVDGIADEDYGNIFKDYVARRTFDDYMRGLRKFDHGLYNKKGYSDNDDDGFKGYKINQYGKGGAGDYQAEKIQLYKASGDKGQQNGDKYDQDENKGEERNRFHEYYLEDPYHKDFFNDEPIKNFFEKYTDGQYESDAGFQNGDAYETAADDDEVAKINDYTKEAGEQENTSDEDSHHGDDQFGAKIGHYHSKSYGYQIEH